MSAARADVWAFGIALFEMLSGVRAFEDEDVSDTVGNVLKAEPDWKVLPDAVPRESVGFFTPRASTLDCESARVE